MVADGFHSVMDASSNFIGIAGVIVAAGPPDDSQSYGNRRFETMATLSIGGLLLVAAWEILKTAVERLFGGWHATAEPISFAVMLVSIVVNLFVTLYETKRGKRLGSDFLMADAAQTRTDLVISLSVILGLFATQAGFAWMDTVIALLIVLLIGRTAFSILSKTTKILVDAAAVDPIEIRRVVEGVPGIDSIIRIRSRGPADSIMTDIDVQVQPATTADHAEAIADEIERRVKAAFCGTNKNPVHFSPPHHSPAEVTLVARAPADALGISITR